MNVAQAFPLLQTSNGTFDPSLVRSALSQPPAKTQEHPWPLPPLPTNNFSFDLNPNAAAGTGSANGTFATSVTIYDSLGTSHIATASFPQGPATSNQWNYSVSIADADMANSPFTPLTGTSTGRLDPTTAPPQPLVISGRADTAAMSLNWNLFDATAPRITQYAQPASTSAVSQDGSAPAQFVQVGVGNGGQILAHYSNGKQTAVRVAGTGGRGSVEGEAVESSTVDPATEFRNLILYQRAYEANSKAVTSVDKLSQTTLQLIQ